MNVREQKWKICVRNDLCFWRQTLQSESNVKEGFAVWKRAHCELQGIAEVAMQIRCPRSSMDACCWVKQTYSYIETQSTMAKTYYKEGQK